MRQAILCVSIVAVCLSGTVYSYEESTLTVPLDGSDTRLVFTTPEGYQQAGFSFGVVPSRAPGDSPQGMSVSLSQGKALTVYGPVVETGPGLCLIACELYASAPDFAVAAAALNVPAGTELSDIDGSIATNQLVAGDGYVGGWKTIEVLYDPQGDALVPVFQAVGTSNTPVTIYVYRMQIIPLKAIPVAEAIERLHLSDSSPVVTPTPTVPTVATSTPIPASEVITASLTIRAFISGVDYLHIKGTQIWYEHISYTLPGQYGTFTHPTIINGFEWFPTWLGNNSNLLEWPETLIPEQNGFYYRLNLNQVQGIAGLLQIPNAENDYELIIALDNQGLGNSAWFDLTLYRSNVPPYPVEPNQFYWSGMIRPFSNGLRMDLKGIQVIPYSDSSNKITSLSYVHSNPLPNYPVNLTVQQLSGTIEATIIEQPRAENNYMAQIYLDKTERLSTGKQYGELLFSWGEEVPPEPTATPWPTQNPNLPSPTPLGTSPHVLWVVMERAFPVTPKAFNRDDFIEFRSLFTQFGAQSDWIIAGSESITSELLSHYAAVVFGDTTTVLPLTEAEQLAVLQYVRGGGSIFVIGNQLSTSILEQSSIYASSITEPFGILFSTRVTGKMFALEPHPLLDSVTEIYGGSQLIVESPARAIAATDTNNALLAIAEPGYGRVVAFADDYPFLTSEISPSEIWYTYGMRRLAQNIAAWLLHKDNLIGATPTPAAMPHMIWTGELGASDGILMEIHGDTVTFLTGATDTLETTSVVFSEPLPNYAVDIRVTVALGNAIATIEQQPRLENNFTVLIRLTQPRSEQTPSAQYLVVTWTGSMIPESTATPVTTGTPTPTPTVLMNATPTPTLPSGAPPVSISRDVAAYIFDRVWNEYDRQYAAFVLRPEVDWAAQREIYRPRALTASTQYELAAILAEMLAPLRDQHVWVKVSGVAIPVYDRPYQPNFNVHAYSSVLGEIHDAGASVQWAKTEAKIGFVAINNWLDTEIPSHVDTVLEYLKDTNALIVDVRNNQGGSESLAKQVAGRFTDRTLNYNYIRYRDGTDHNDLSDFISRGFTQRGLWHYDKPVIVLIGQKSMSSNESFIAMMGECPQVTLMGDRTRGSSGGPIVLNLPVGISVSLPRWIAYLLDRTPLDDRGIWPDVWFEPETGAFEGDRDDLLSAALEQLHEVATGSNVVTENFSKQLPNGTDG